MRRNKFLLLSQAATSEPRIIGERNPGMRSQQRCNGWNSKKASVFHRFQAVNLGRESNRLQQSLNLGGTRGTAAPV